MICISEIKCMRVVVYITVREKNRITKRQCWTPGVGISTAFGGRVKRFSGLQCRLLSSAHRKAFKKAKRDSSFCPKAP